MKEQSALFIEIFGCDEIPAPSAPLAPLATDDLMFEYTARTGKADALCAQLENDAFVADATGLEPAEVRKINADAPEPSVFAKTAQRENEIEALNRKFEALVNREVNLALLPIRGQLLTDQRTADLARRTPTRKREIDKMLLPLKALFADATIYEDRFSSLRDAMQQFITGAIISEA